MAQIVHGIARWVRSNQIICITQVISSYVKYFKQLLYLYHIFFLSKIIISMVVIQESNMNIFSNININFYDSSVDDL